MVQENFRTNIYELIYLIQSNLLTLIVSQFHEWILGM